MDPISGSNENSTLRRLTISMPCRLGLHIRTASNLVNLAKKFNSQIRIRKGSLVRDGKSILGLLLLEATWNSRLEIEAEGKDAAQAIEAMGAFFAEMRNCAGEDAFSPPLPAGK